MTTSQSTRRSFMWTAGAALSAPLAAVAAAAPASVARDGDALMRLAALEDIGAIRALNQAFARLVDGHAHEEIKALFINPADVRIDPEVRGLTADGFGEQDAIEVAGDRTTATALLHCTVHAESPIEPDCPLLEMARQQGGGVVRRVERGVFENVYIRRDGVWKIQRSTYRPA